MNVNGALGATDTQARFEGVADGGMVRSVEESEGSRFVMTVGAAVGTAVLVVLAVIVTVMVMRWKISQRVFEIPEPEFDLDTDEELVKLEGNIGVEVSDDEEDGPSYETGDNFLELKL